MKKLFALAMVLVVLSAAVFAQGGQEATYPTRNINASFLMVLVVQQT